MKASLLFRFMMRHGVSALAVALSAQTALADAPKPPPAPPLPDPAAHTVIVPYAPGQKLQGQEPERYWLPYESFQKLWQAAKENRRPERVSEADEEQEAEILSAMYQGQIAARSLVLEARLQVMSRGRWTPLELNFALDEDTAGEVLVGEVTVDGKPAGLQEGRLLLEKPGPHAVALTLTLPCRENWQKAALRLPAALGGALSLEAPSGEGWPRVNGVAFHTAEVRGDTRVFTTALGRHEELRIERQPRGLVRGEDAVPLAGAALVLKLGRLLPDRVQARLEYEFPGATRRTLAYSMDEGITLTSSNVYTEAGGQQVLVPTDAMVTRREKGRVHVTLTLRHEVTHRAVLEFAGVRAGTAEAVVPLLQPAAARVQQQVTLLHEPTLDVKALPAAGQSRQADAGAPAGLKSAGTFKLATATDRLAYQVKPATELDEALVNYVYQISEQKCEMLAALSLRRKQGGWTRARIGLPAGFEVQAVAGPALQQWQHVGDALFLHLDPVKAGADARVMVHLARTVDQAALTWTLEPLKLEGFTKVTGRGWIAAHAAMQVRLPALTGRTDLEETDPSLLDSVFSIAPPFEKKRGLRMEGTAWSLEVGLARQAPRFSADSIALVLASDAGIRISQQVAFLVDQGALRQVSVRLPATLPEAAVSGPLLREMRTRVEGAERVYECSFQTDVLDRAELTFDHDLPLAATLAVPLVKVPGAERLQRYFVLDNASAREARVAGSAALEAISRDVVPYLPDGLARAQFFRATSDASRLEMAYTQLSSTEGNAALVTLADITTVLRADGERWDQVTYSLINRSLQFLPVVLPQGAELITASVSGGAVRADEETRDGRRVRLIPLIQTKPGQRALEVRLIYRFPHADLQTRPVLDDPDLVGLSVERTAWTVWAPPGHELGDFDGNMEEVTEEGKEYQVLEGILSEIKEVNRALASGKLGYDEAEKAYKAAEDLTRRVESKRRALVGRETATMADDMDGKPASTLRKQVQSAQDIDRGLLQQQELLKENRSNIAAKSEKAQVAKPAGKAGAKTDWSFNDASAVKAEGQVRLQLQNTFSGTLSINGGVVANDNIAVNGYFFDNSSSATPTTAGAAVNSPEPAQKPAAPISSVIGSNARGNNLSFGDREADGKDKKAMGGEMKGKMEVVDLGNALLADSVSALPRVAPVTRGGVGGMSAQKSARAMPSMPANALGASAPKADPFAATAPAAPPPPPAESSVAPGLRSSSTLIVPSAAPADPFAAPRSQGPAAYASGDLRRDGAAALVREEEAMMAQTLESLRPTGRRSLELELPQEGTARHFSKIKDHAVLELRLDRPWSRREVSSAWVLGLGILLAGGWAWLGRRRAGALV